MKLILLLLMLIIITYYFVKSTLNRRREASYIKAGRKWEGIIKELSKRK